MSYEPGCDHLVSLVFPKSLFKDMISGKPAGKGGKGKPVLYVTGEDKCWECAQEGMEVEEEEDDDVEW
jgi:hypothetical protein